VRRIGLVVHPSRPIDKSLATLADWAAMHEIEVVQLMTGESKREVAPPGEVDACDVVVAMGGDGTVLTALRGAAPTGTPVMGIACGSLGALTAVRAPQLETALEGFRDGSWRRRDLPALEVAVDGAVVAWALNDLVLLRRTGQLVVHVKVEDELYARMAGDGVVVATALGSSAYSMAAGGPVLAAGTGAYVVTPLVVHGGSTPPLVVPADRRTTLEAHPGFSGFDIEIDGHEMELTGATFTVTLVDGKATLVALSEPGVGLETLRRRGLVTDSPRVLARDARES
jgi:NAD+ kinase